MPPNAFSLLRDCSGNPSARVTLRSMKKSDPSDLVGSLASRASDESASVARHRAACQVCCHSERAEIEARYLAWHDPADIAKDARVPLRSLHRHSALSGLDVRRANDARLALGRFLERGLARLQPPESVAEVTELVQAIRATVDQNASGAPADQASTWEERIDARSRRV